MIDERDETEVADLEDEYELLNELGRGGSAVVYRARDKALGREVAIKVVHTRTAGANDEAIARLAREARTVAKLQHPNIVTVYAVKRLREGGLALVMQLVPGRTLKQAIAEDGAFSAEQAERVIRDVAQALAYAHAAGVVHRDVKPENIFIDETSGRAMLSDFGIAHSSEFDSRLTMTGAAIGTPAYMSPEQIDGAPANARSDVYSLGLVSWEMLTGERPWEGETLYNVIFKQKHEELLTIDELRPHAVPPRLQYIVERMLQKRPAARWAGAEGLLTILTAWVVPNDWKQWEEAHQRRRELVKAAAKGKAPTPATTPSATSQATVRFPRPRTPTSEQVVVPANEARAHLAATASDIDDADDDAPSWASTPLPARHGVRTIGIVVAIMFVAGSFGAYAWKSGRIPMPASWSDQFGDVARPVSVITTQTLAQELADSLRALRGDTSALATLPAVTDSQAVSAATGTVPPLPTTGMPQPQRSGISPSATTLAVADIGSGAPGRTSTPILPLPAAPKPVAAVPSPPAAKAEVSPTMRATNDRAIVAAGGRHSCVITNGRIFCWGANDRGQLGDGESESRDTPDGIAGDIEFTQVVAGIEHSCGLTRGGDAYCWGSNERGQLGDATTSTRSAPVRVAGNVSFQTLSAGQRHTCGLTVQGDIACWGFNQVGQLGDGTTTTRSSPFVLKTPVKFIAVSTGWTHSCALSYEGTAYCWGDNSTGQLGDDSRTAHRAPEPVGGGLHFSSIAAGNGHTCAVTEAGEAYCWGRNTSGQLGLGTNAESDVPARVETSTRFASVSLGSSHSCGRTRAGQVWCWGLNNYGQLGDGTTTARNVPVRVTGTVPFVAMNVIGAHTCGSTADGETWCWGYNTDGQLGDGTRSNHARPSRISLPAR